VSEGRARERQLSGRQPCRTPEVTVRVEDQHEPAARRVGGDLQDPKAAGELHGGLGPRQPSWVSS
jgi:hypothetical protein